MSDKILILDFGSQVTQLIARRLREINVLAEVANFDIAANDIKKSGAKALIFSGGPASVNEDFSPQIDPEIFNLNLPILGICYGQQLICKHFGANIKAAKKREFGKAFIEITQNHPLFADIKNLDNKQQVWMSHGDVVSSLPDKFHTIAKTEDAPYAVIANDAEKIYGMQFHPEVTHTPIGTKLLENFAVKVAKCNADWTMANYKNTAIENIKKQVGDAKVICGISGGVDSTVTAQLIHEAIGDNLTCIFVNNGLLRKNEAEEVQKRFTEEFKINFIYADASESFLNKLANISDPEQKRKIIGNNFIDVFDAEAQKIDNVKFLAQGTLYPDVIESTHPNKGASSTIKSHHNVGGLPETMKLDLVEPLRELFKDEVRALGRELNISEDLLMRHPFPGPGLAIRIPGEITKEKIQILQDADHIYISALKEAGLYDKIWQAFAVLLPVRTVGVMGDARTYEYVLALRAVNSSDGMTADYYPFEHEFLGSVSNRIINQIRGINRVTYDITSKPPGTIEWE
jgi:GMP synthase (glutamine-hydrolysing)